MSDHDIHASVAHPMRVGSLFSGYGGLDLAVAAAFGATTAWFVEFDEAPSKILAHHWPDVPNYGDVTAVDWASVEPVDILTGGFPCQDVSAAGRRAGMADGTRSGLWSHMAAAIDILRPSLVVIENVKGLLSATAHRPMESEPDALGDRNAQPVLRALGAVLGDLSDLGYDAQWCTVAAADVGAPHRRERVFILAHPADADGHGLDRFSELDGEPQTGFEVRAGGHADRCDVETARPRVDLCPTCAAALADGLLTWQCPDPNVCGTDDDIDLLPTPTSQNSHGNHTRSNGTPLLPGVARAHAEGSLLLPTPRSRDHKGATASRAGDGHDLPSALLPTPEAKLANSGPDFARAGRAGSGGDDLITTAARAEQAQSWGKYEAAIARAERAVGRPAPSPTELNRNNKPRLNAAFAEWMMMLPDGWVTDPAIGLSRSEQLKAIGNGVCPPQAAYALRQLLQIAAR